MTKGSGRSRERAVGHSRFVSLMKVVLPSLALLLGVLVVLWPRLQNTASDLFSLGFSGLGGQSVEAQRLVNARYHGTDSANQPFMVTAELAEETEAGSGKVRLNSPKADLTLRDGAWVMMAARQGLYSQDSQDLVLSGGVDVFHDEGHEMHTPSVTLNLRAGTAIGREGVSAQGPLGALTAEGFVYERDAGRVEFTGQTRLLLRPEATRDGLAAQGTAPSGPAARSQDPSPNPAPQEDPR